MPVRCGEGGTVAWREAGSRRAGAAAALRPRPFRRLRRADGAARRSPGDARPRPARPRRHRSRPRPRPAGAGGGERPRPARGAGASDRPFLRRHGGAAPRHRIARARPLADPDRAGAVFAAGRIGLPRLQRRDRRRGRHARRGRRGRLARRDRALPRPLGRAGGLAAMSPRQAAYTVGPHAAGHRLRAGPDAGRRGSAGGASPASPARCC